eukprot:NODE_1054_length_1659_cov_0.201923.p1 type:complete len:161 gc:universal NODE_1054_length_1659_cov_0.201923:898-1380(+)
MSMLILLLFCLFSTPLEKRQSNAIPPISPNNRCYGKYVEGYQYGFYDGYWYALYYYQYSYGSTSPVVGSAAPNAPVLGTTTPIVNAAVNPVVNPVDTVAAVNNPVTPALQKRSLPARGTPIPGLPTRDGETDFSQFPNYHSHQPAAAPITEKEATSAPQK